MLRIKIVENRPTVQPCYPVRRPAQSFRVADFLDDLVDAMQFAPSSEVLTRYRIAQGAEDVQS